MPLEEGSSAEAAKIRSDDKWITVHPNGEGTGQRVLLGNGGEIKGGMGGKHNGENIAAVSEPNKSETPKAPAPPPPAAASKPSGAPVTGKSSHEAAKVAMDARETEAMKNYAGAMFRSVNPALRAGKKVPKEDVQDLKKMDEVFSRASTKEPMTVYRGLSGDVIDKLTVGSEFRDGGFSSATSDKDVADNFARGDKKAIMEIRVPKGSKAVSVQDIGQFGKGEKEILLNRGGKFKVVEVKAARRGQVGKVIVEYSE